MLEGREEVRGWMQGFFDAFPEIEHTHCGLTVEGDSVSTDLRISGAHTLPFVTPQGTLPPTGRAIDFVAHNEMDVENGSIRSLRISFDPGELMQQLGAA